MSFRITAGIRLAAAGAAATALLGLGVAQASASTTPTGSTIAATQPAPNGVAGYDYSVALPIAGVGTRWYRLFVPAHLPRGPRPLIVAVHYYGGSATSFESMTDFDPGAVANGAIVAYPQGIGNSWNGGTCCGTARDTNAADVAFLDAVITDVEARYAVDTTRIAMGGFSNGGIMSYRYACERSSRVQWFFVDGAVDVAPTCAFNKPVNFFHIHGLADTTVPWGGTTTQPLFTNGIVPDVASTIGGVAALDGCKGWTTTITSPVVTRYVANNCPAGASFTTLTSTTLIHKWPVGPVDLATYGINATGATWSYLLSGWAKLPAAA